jgi:hypothetical protein
MSSDEIVHLRSTLDEQRRKHRQLELQAAEFSAGYVPVHLINGITDATRQIADLEQRLSALGIDPSTMSEADILLNDHGSVDPTIDQTEQPLAIQVNVGRDAYQTNQAGGINFGSAPIGQIGQVIQAQNYYAGTSLPVASLPRRVPFMAPRLEMFVKRPVEFQAIMQALLGSQDGQQVAITTAIRGAGGFGKTTLAIMVCHDPQIAAAFPDGVLWGTLGEQPDVMGTISVLYRGLTDTEPRFINLEDATSQLAKTLVDKRCLIVLDDVWQAISLAPFQRIATPSTWLITTRMLDIAPQSQVIKVDEMTGAESVGLLTLRLTPPPADLAPFYKLAQRLGEWPLLLNLAGAYLSEHVTVFGQALDQALMDLAADYDAVGLIAFNQRDTIARNAAADRSLKLSLDLLDDLTRQQLVELAIFPEDTSIPLSVVAQLWGTNERITRTTVQLLARLSLLQLDLTSGSIHLHDVVRAYLAIQLTDASSVHLRLVNFRTFTQFVSFLWLAVDWLPSYRSGAGYPVVFTTTRLSLDQ